MVSVGNADIAGFASIMFMTCMIILNLFTLIFIALYFGWTFTFPRFVLWGLVCIPIALYFLLVNNGKSKKIKEHFIGENSRARLIGRIVILSYIFLSVGAFIGSMFLKFI